MAYEQTKANQPKQQQKNVLSKKLYKKIKTNVYIVEKTKTNVSIKNKNKNKKTKTNVYALHNELRSYHQEQTPYDEVL